MSKTRKFNGLHIAISWGASIVILGAMFKINHLGGILGTYMIGIGLAIEALLFFLTGFFPPPEEPEWDKIFEKLQANTTPQSIDVSIVGDEFSAKLNQAARKFDLLGNAFEKMSSELAETGVTLQNLNEFAADSKHLKEEVDKLSKNISALNVFYANMLSGINQPRG